MKNELIKTVAKTASTASVRTMMKLRKASPEIMLAGGIVVGIAAIVTACVATKKLSDEKVIENANAELDDILQDEAEGKLDSRAKRRESFKVYCRYIGKLIKIFGPSAFLFLLSMGLFLGSHGVLKKRYVSTTLAYKALDDAFKDYRKRIKDAVGEEKELHYYNGTHEGGETVIVDENGVKTEKTIVKEVTKLNCPYEFDWNARTAPGNWEANSDYNMMFLQGIQGYANDLLNSRGHVFLNEVLDAIGLKRTPAGAVTGWIKGCGGDDFVDFGLSEYYTDEYSDAHQDGYLNNIHLNFNVDGLIWNAI